MSKKNAGELYFCILTKVVTKTAKSNLIVPYSLQSKENEV